MCRKVAVSELTVSKATAKDKPILGVRTYKKRQYCLPFLVLSFLFLNFNTIFNDGHFIICSFKPIIAPVLRFHIFILNYLIKYTGLVLSLIRLNSTFFSSYMDKFIFL